jgi:guanylate kinase
MHGYTIITWVMLLTLPDSPVLGDTIFRWSDKQGQVSFSDIAPNDAMSVTRITEPDPPREIDGSGLRPAERELLLRIKQRTQQQAKNAQARRLQNSRKRAEQWEHCESYREKLHNSSGEETYKQYSRYLRTHCW